jgi:hypothetical protein
MGKSEREIQRKNNVKCGVGIIFQVYFRSANPILSLTCS